MSERASAAAGRHAAPRTQRARVVRRTTTTPPGSHRGDRGHGSPLLPAVRHASVAGVLVTASLSGVALVHGQLERASAQPAAPSTSHFAAVTRPGLAAAPSAVRQTRVSRSLAESDGPAVLRSFRETSYAPDHLARALPGCPPPTSTAGFENGKIPASALCTLPDGQRLRSDAAAAWVALSAAFEKEFGTTLVVTDSYRSLAVQKKLKKAKPVLAAVPGTSQHGLGIAVDLGGGIQTLGSEQHDWMLKNAPGYGWDNPDWARPGGSKLEPWHWEYTPPGKHRADPPTAESRIDS